MTEEYKEVSDDMYGINNILKHASFRPTLVMWSASLAPKSRWRYGVSPRHPPVFHRRLLTLIQAAVELNDTSETHEMN